jgi:pimeloyl-ACP methyl ester carboxylesterase
MRLNHALFCLLMLYLVGCTVAPPAERAAQADNIARGSGLQPLLIETGTFDIHARLRAASDTSLLVIYIEGDGLAWRTRNTPSTDPTPLEPVALRLAAADDAPSVAWLARPCQFAGGETARNCTKTWWTDGRYGEAVIDSLNASIDTLKQRTGAATLALVGYSGGGTVATLIAARRDDIVWLKTVASPLDTEAFTTHHKVTPLSASLNPADHAPRLTRLPQIHYVGSDDAVVPPDINQAIASRLNEEGCATLRIMPGIGHGAGWSEAWRTRASEIPACEARNGQPTSP